MELRHDDLKDLRVASNILLNFEMEESEQKKFRNIVPNEELKDSLDNYRSSGHYDINNVFRGLKKGSEITQKLDTDINNLKEAMNIVRPFRYNKGKFIVWRGIDLSKNEYHPDKKRYYYEIIELHKNGTSNNQSFLSTSYSKEVALTFTDCCLFKIFVDPKEDLDYILIDIMGEKEILFQHTTYFRWLKEYFETDEEEEKSYKVFEVSLHKGSVIKEYTYVEKIVKDDTQLYNEIVKRIPGWIDEEMVKNLKDDFGWDLEETQEDLYGDFIKSMSNSYPDDLESIKKYEKELKNSVYSHVKDLFLK